MKNAISSALLAIVIVAAPVANAQVVQIAPPAPVVEVIPAAPSPRHIWVPGYHRWDGHLHIWVPGAYVVPPGHFTRWEPGRWETVHGGYRFHRGEWR